MRKYNMKKICPQWEGHKVIDFGINQPVSLVEYICMPNMKSLLFKVPQLWPKLKVCFFLLQTDKRTIYLRIPFQGHKE